MPTSDRKVAWREFESILRHSAEDAKFFSLFLEDMLTPEEKNTLALRWQIVKELRRGTPQRTIAQKLDVATATITRGSRLLHNPKGACTTILSMQNSSKKSVGRAASWRKQLKSKKP